MDEESRDSLYDRPQTPGSVDEAKVDPVHFKGGFRSCIRTAIPFPMQKLH